MAIQYYKFKITGVDLKTGKPLVRSFYGRYVDGLINEVNRDGTLKGKIHLAIGDAVVEKEAVEFNLKYGSFSNSFENGRQKAVESIQNKYQDRVM
jgi:hypothetical protein